MPDLADLSATAGVCGALTIPRRAGSLVATKDVPAQGPQRGVTRKRMSVRGSELRSVALSSAPPPGLVGVLAEQSWEIPPLDDGARATTPKLSGSEAGGLCSSSTGAMSSSLGRMPVRSRTACEADAAAPRASPSTPRRERRHRR